MRFSDIFLTKVDLARSGGARPQVSGSFDYSKVRLDYWTILPNGSRGPDTWAEYDLRLNKGSVAALAGVYALGLAGPAALVPEPETYAMLLAGLGLIGAISRRKRA